MTKNTLLVVILILFSVLFLIILYVNKPKSINHISGQVIAEHLDFKTGYVQFRKYAVNGYARGEEKSMDLPYSEFLRIKSSIQELPDTSITVTGPNIEDLNFVSHTLYFQTSGSLIILADYSLESNRLIFNYSDIFRNADDKPIFDRRLIVLKMNDSFKEWFNLFQGKE